MPSKYKYRYKSKNPNNTYAYNRQQLYDIDINNLRTEKQLKAYISKAAQLVEEEASRGIELLQKGRTTTGRFTQAKVSNPTLLKSVQEKAQQLLEQEYVGISDSEMFNYLKQEAGKARQLLGYKSGTYEETIRGYESFIAYIKKYTGKEISFKEAEKIVPLIEAAYTSPTSRFNRMMYATQTKQIIETVEQIRTEREQETGRKTTFLDVLNENSDLLEQVLGINGGGIIEDLEVDDGDIIPIFKGYD